MQDFVNCDNVIKTYHDGSVDTQVLKGLSLHIAKGQQVAIVGSSGSGKSTLLHILGTLDKATQGTVFIDGVNTATLKANELAEFRNQKLGFIYQFHHLLMDFTALENVAMPLMIRNEPVNKANEMALAMLDKVGLAHRVNHKPSELSGGERQRVAIARALVTQPALILADEPTGNLDQENAIKIYELLRTLNKELHTTFIVVTHDMELANKMDQVLTLHNGQIESLTATNVQA
ncbi:lipoprotein-releasing ABC transporter ATP-binding protein LolD [Flocculibacter collagenilyticus]|uniref:lipoprotein-releasing ABC transporter ATP-binding protein LolD n=1 Tax=Flocculibacter collagenilyticus TaxID=2744479 RepID=UPI0018F57A9C|nr:lipoprotein-releasing ABC transporter ATP-binding protein LolD [Flocculibacter collagenilyticus]